MSGLTENELVQLAATSRQHYLSLPAPEKSTFTHNFRNSSYFRTEHSGEGVMGRPDGGEQKFTEAPLSLMRTIGTWGFWLSLVALLVGFVMALNGSGIGIVTLFLGSGVGLFAFMWMLGAIEMRLIEINQTLKSQGKADS